MRAARDVMADLAATGMTPDQIALVMELTAAISAEARPVADEAAERRRERDREYQAQKRAERRQISADSSDVADAATDLDKNIPQTPYKNSIPPVTPKGVTAPKGAKRTRGSRIDPDWSPPEAPALPPEARALAEQWTPASYKTEAAAFVAYWLGESGAKASKADWGRAWQNRIVQIHSKVMRDQKFGNAAPEPPKAVTVDAASLDRKAALFRKMGQDEDAADCERRAARMRQGGGTATIGSIVAGLGP